MTDSRRPEEELEELEALEAEAKIDGESSDEAEERRERRKRRAANLSDDIAKKYDPSRLLKLVSSKAGKGERLDAATRARYERKLGVDLGDVRIYTGEFAEEVTKAHTAEAVTVGGTGMILMSGSPDRSMATTAGRALLAHELTHVAQASRGVHRSAAMGAAPVLATEEHEEEAETREAEEYIESVPELAKPDISEGERYEEVRDAVLERVLEMFADDERVHEMRNGGHTFRP
jgi:hypothetical protein